jgi:DNA-binding transcriptional ArsR family regulator
MASVLTSYETSWGSRPQRSRHLTLLTEAELLIATRKKGWTFYRRDEPALQRFTALLDSDL